MKRKVNLKVVIFSLIAFGFIALGYLVNWAFLIGTIVMIWLNQKELMKGRVNK